jgi:MFS family permease
LVLPGIVVRFGIRRLLIAALLASAAILLSLPTLPDLMVWFVLRLCLGMASEVLFVLSETWANSLSTEETRGRTMAIYTALLSSGFALGPVTLTVLGGSGAQSYIIGAIVAVLAAGLMLSNRIRAPHFEPAPKRNPLHLLRAAPLAMSATMLNAAIESAGLSFLAVYAMRLGWAESGATGLMAIMMVGAILLQIPLGWLADHVDRRKLLIVLSGLATLGALVWPLAIGHPWAIYTLLFAWGGAFVGIYTVMLAVIGSRFANTELVAIYAGMGLMWGLGAFLGPVLAGAAMQVTTHGLAFYATGVCGLFTLLALRLSTDGSVRSPEWR